MPEETIVVVHTVASYFGATPEERQRLAEAPALSMDPATWKEFANATRRQVLKAYQEGEITLHDALRAVWSCSVGCNPPDRVVVLATTTKQAITRPEPCKPDGTPLVPDRRRKNPKWVRYSAATLVEMLWQTGQYKESAPNYLNGMETQILNDARDLLRKLGLCDVDNPQTIYKWCLEAQKDGAIKAENVAAET